jgi:hypothetical protein
VLKVRQKPLWLPGCGADANNPVIRSKLLLSHDVVEEVVEVVEVVEIVSASKIMAAQ